MACGMTGLAVRRYTGGRMDPSHLREYANRDWGAAERLDARHWRDEIASRGASATLEASQALRRHMELVRPDFPSAEERNADLQDHIAVKRMLDRAAGAFRVLTGR